MSELLASYSGMEPEAGCDEAGRGCLAGPVVAAAVILPPDFQPGMLNDSKKLTERQRNLLRPLIERVAVAWSVAVVGPDIIDQINILNATFQAMNEAIASLQVVPAHLVIDGNRFRNSTGIPYTCVVGGDAKILSVAAASVLAKTHRDEIMTRLSSEFPHYQWIQNKGYPTKLHREAISVHGLTSWHRVSFRHSSQQLMIWPSDSEKNPSEV